MINKRRATLLTLILNLSCSLVSGLTGLIFTGFILRSYGSSVNGLISSINQFVSLFSIVEGGITTAAIIAIYKPFSNNDFISLNNILYTAKKIYFRIGIAISLLVLFFGSIYLKFVNSVYTYNVLFILLLISMLQLVLGLIFESRYSILFSGSNQEYKAIMIRMISRLSGWILAIYFILSHRHILIVYSTFLITTILNILMLKFLISREIPQAKYYGEYNQNFIKGSRDILTQKIASVAFYSTDLVIISTMINLQMASLYVVYNMVYKAISTIVFCISQAPANSFGQLVSKEEQSNTVFEFFSIYETIVIVTTAIFMCVTFTMVIPFVQIYTIGIRDITYVNYYISAMFFTMFYLQMLNKPYANIINVTGNFHLQNPPMLISVIINLIISIFGAMKFGLYGVLSGSIVGLIIIVGYNMVSAFKYILKKEFVMSILRVVFNYLLCLLIKQIIFKIAPKVNTYLELIILSAIVFVVVTAIIIMLNSALWYRKMRSAFLFFKSSIKNLS